MFSKLMQHIKALHQLAKTPSLFILDVPKQLCYCYCWIFWTKTYFISQDIVPNKSWIHQGSINIKAAELPCLAQLQKLGFCFLWQHLKGNNLFTVFVYD